MRTIFFIIIFVFVAASSFGQNAPKKPGKEGDGKLSSPDVSVLYDNPSGKQNAPKAKTTDTMNIIPPMAYSRLSFGGSFGMTFYAGDIPADAIYPAFGGYAKVSLSHLMGIRLQYMQGKFSGASNSKKYIDNAYFQTKVSNVNLQLIFNLGSVDYRQSFPRNNFYFGVGASLQNLNGSRDNPDTPSIVTRTINESMLAFPFTVGFKRKVSKNIDIGFELSYYFGSNDNLDLITAGKSSDGNGYFNVNVVYNLTTKSKPKHMDWSNPIDKIYRDLQDAKDEAASMKIDTDQDGIPDFLDQEPNTKSGYKVDNKGVTLDSDEDGIPDSIDPDPYGFSKSLGIYFPSGIGVGSDSMETIYQFSDSVPQTDFVTISKSGLGLPTIVFPPNRFTIHVEQYNLLQQIARIMMVDTSASLVIIGHSDNNKPNLTQLTLAERRALEVKRKLYKIYEIDEKRMLVFSSKDSYVEKYQLSTEGLDRKVEFKIIRPVQRRKPRVDKENLNKDN
ncbi:MAG: OmpA family protein [bacterium]|nr:OmpA family protein [bacterium]